jgi:polyribonucleotide nucleotidyltransferase
MSTEISVDIGSASLKINTGYLAKQADGAVTVTSGETVVFASAVASREVREGQDFFPLTVDYREKWYAAGKFPGGFIKREGRPSDREILTSRLTDRPMRPLFPKDFINEVQIILYVFSSDGETQSDILAINAASAALSISGLPFKGPVGAVRIGRINGQWIINPTHAQTAESDIDLIVAGTSKAVTMIEGESKNVSENDMITAVELAHENIRKICEIQVKLAGMVGKPAFQYTPASHNAALEALMREKYLSAMNALDQIREKKGREDRFNALVKQIVDENREQFPDTIGQVRSIADDMDKEIVRVNILDKKQRPDGRGLKEIRPIDIIAGILPRAHGSAVFTRGQTQSLGIVTLGSVSDAQRIDNIDGESSKRFMLHYNFPPFSVGETGRTGGAGRRETGHGMLAERSLTYALPDVKDFPYTIRVVSEILESNGSSSMASVCSGSLSMFNAGVPMKSAVAGIAMGLIMEGDRYSVLSDIMGLEDHLGDMDFKVAGTETGITAFQMDIKIEGITPAIMREALEQAREGRLHILGKMKEAIPQPEKQMSPHAPRIVTLQVPIDKIGDVIGPGGRIIKGIVEETKADVNIDNDGTVTISGHNQKSLDSAVDIVMSIIAEVEVGKIYRGTVKRVMEYGAFVEILRGKEGLVHISKLDHKKVNNVSDILKEGDVVNVKVLGIDKIGRIDLSRKDALDSRN